MPMTLGMRIALAADGRWYHRDCYPGQVAATCVVDAQPMINMV